MSLSFFSVLSVFLGLLLVNCAIVVTARASHVNLFTDVPREVRDVGMFALILLTVLNANQWIPGEQLFGLLSLIAIGSLMFAAKKVPVSSREDAILDGVYLVGIQIVALIAVFVAFKMHRYWLLEGTNHDSLVYYQGLHWANESALFVGKEAVRARWGLGVCGEGASWVGYDCALYRGGTYTVSAWAQYFAPQAIGHALYFIIAYAATMAWFASRLITEALVGKWRRLSALVLTLVVTFSTGFIGALVNSNLATILGAAALVPIVSLALRADLSPHVRFGLMATWSAVAAHLYAEAVFYAGLLIGIVFMLELPRNFHVLRLRGIVRLAGGVGLIVLVLGNVAVGQAFSSLFAIGEIDKGAEWFSWYLHNPPMFWLGSFIAGILMWAVEPSIPVVAVATVITLCAATAMLRARQARTGTLALIITSAIAVAYLEATAYQYGEHKVVHLLGPAWVLLVGAASFRVVSWSAVVSLGRQRAWMAVMMGLTMLSCLAGISANFFVRSVHVLKDYRGSHGIDFGLSDLASHPRPGDAVLIDDTAWLGVEKFHKNHYLTFQLHNQGAEVLLPNISGDPLRGGYFRLSRQDTLSQADRVDWLVQSRGHALSSSKVMPPDAVPVAENADYRLYRVAKKPVAVAGNGWYECEPSHCWTTAPFEIEVYVPQSGEFELSVEFDTFLAPESGIITVRNGDGRVVTTARASDRRMTIALSHGWSRLVFESNWNARSPLEAGMSADPRLLFAAIRRVRIGSSHGEMPE